MSIKGGGDDPAPWLCSMATDNAIHWLLSLIGSSPSQNPANPTDWMYTSPHAQPGSIATSQFDLYPPPFQDLTSSTRVNEPQPNYTHDYSDFLGVSGASSSGYVAQAPPDLDPVLPISIPNTIFNFNSHHRMHSLDSTTTLVNSPSSCSFALFSPSVTAVHSQSPQPSSNSDLFSSPTSKVIQDLHQDTSVAFEEYYDSVASLLPADPLLDISPVVRSERLRPTEASSATLAKTTKPRRGGKKKKHLKVPSFVEKLRSVPPISQDQSYLFPPPPQVSSNDTTTQLTVLMSPCKLAGPTRGVSSSVGVALLPGLAMLQLPEESPARLATPPASFGSQHSAISSPLTPLTPLSSSSPGPPLREILQNTRKRKQALDLFTPLRRSKRSRRATAFQPLPSPSPERTPSSSLSPESTAEQCLVPLFSNRTLPPTIQVSNKYPLFYRRFPVSSYFQPEGSDSPCALFDKAMPGGIYNTPRSPLDLYTPRFVKGKGPEKVGLCPICIEPHSRGGEQRKLWLAMKFSAFKCYHMQYAHGISASTGRPFSPPTAFRTVPRPNPGKKEKHQIEQGKCHRCANWVAVEGVKDMESKVKELYWWKHAATCHHDSALEGETDYYETDDVLTKLQWL